MKTKKNAQESNASQTPKPLVTPPGSDHPAPASPRVSTPLINGDDPDPKFVDQLNKDAARAVSQGSLKARRFEIKARAGSFLRRLTPAERERVFQWVLRHSICEAVNLVAQPPPAGFGLRVNPTTLSRIRATVKTVLAAERFENSAFAAEALAEEMEQKQVDFAPVVADLLMQKTFDLARSEQASAAQLKEITDNFVKLRELELKTHRLRLGPGRREREDSPQRHQVDLKIVAPVPGASQSPAFEIEVVPRRSAGQLPASPASAEPAPVSADLQSPAILPDASSDSP